LLLKLPLRLALRFIFKPKSRRLVHLISSISMFVIAMVVAAMIVVLSAFNGLEKLVSDLFGTLDAEIAVIPKTGETIDEGLLNLFKDHEAVAFCSAIIENEAIISANGITEVCTVMGVDHNYENVSGIRESMVSGQWGSGGDCLVLG